MIAILSCEATFLLDGVLYYVCKIPRNTFYFTEKIILFKVVKKRWEIRKLGELKKY